MWGFCKADVNKGRAEFLCVIILSLSHRPSFVNSIVDFHAVGKEEGWTKDCFDLGPQQPLCLRWTESCSCNPRVYLWSNPHGEGGGVGGGVMNIPESSAGRAQTAPWLGIHERFKNLPKSSYLPYDFSGFSTKVFSFSQRLKKKVTQEKTFCT